MVYTYDERVIMEKLVDMGNARDIVSALCKNTFDLDFDLDKMIMETLIMMADGVCEFYVAIVNENAMVYNAKISESYAKAQKNAKRLFLIERGVGFDMYELPC